MCDGFHAWVLKWPGAIIILLVSSLWGLRILSDGTDLRHCVLRNLEDQRLKIGRSNLCEIFGSKALYASV